MTKSEELNGVRGNLAAKQLLAAAYHGALEGRYSPLEELCRSGEVYSLSLDLVRTTSPIDAGLFAECAASAARAAADSDDAVRALGQVATALKRRYPYRQGDPKFIPCRAQELIEPALSEIFAGEHNTRTLSVLDHLYEADPRHFYIAVSPGDGGAANYLLTLAVTSGKQCLVEHMLWRWPEQSLASAGFNMKPGPPSDVFSLLYGMSVRTATAAPSLVALQEFAKTSNASQLGITPVGADFARSLLIDSTSEQAFLHLLNVDILRVGDVSPTLGEGESPYLLALAKGFVGAAELLRNNGLASDALIKLIRLSKGPGVSVAAVDESLKVDGVDVDALTCEGDRATVTAARHGRVDLVKLLIERGADPLLPDAKGRTPLKSCPAEQKPELAAILAAHESRRVMGALSRGSRSGP